MEGGMSYTGFWWGILGVKISLWGLRVNGMIIMK